MSKRYWVFFTAFLTAALILRVLVEWDFSALHLICGMTAIVMPIGFLIKCPRTALYCCVGWAFGLLYFSGYTALFAEPLEKLDGKDLVISAEVTEYATVYEDSQRVEIKVDAADLGIDYPFSTFKTLLSLPPTEEELRPGDRLQVRASFYLPNLSEGFDRRLYQASQGRFIQASSLRRMEASEEPFAFEIEPRASTSILHWPLDLAEHWRATCKEKLEPRIASFMISLLIGDTTELSDLDDMRMKRSGLSHIIAVSGMHLTYMVTFFVQVFGKRWGTILSIPAMLFFTVMAGATPSVVRALIMALAAAYSFLGMYRTDPPTVFAFALSVLLIANPYAIASVSLQLSFLSTLGLMLYSQNMSEFFHRPFRNFPKRIRKLTSVAVSAVSCSLCSMLFTTPVLLSTFGYVTLVSPLSNLFSLSIANMTFIFGAIFCILPCLSPILAPILSACIRFVLDVAEISSEAWPLILNWRGNYAKASVVIACLIIVVLLARKYSRPKFTLPLLCAILILCVWQNAELTKSTVTTTIHPVGDGQMITVATGRDTVSLIDCGSSGYHDSVETLEAYMNWNGFEKIDTLVLTGIDKKHARDLERLTERYPIRRIIYPDRLRQTEFVKSTIEFMDGCGIPCISWKVAGESPINLGDIPSTVLGGTKGKLGVRIETDEGDVLVLHSYTQKMLHAALDSQPMQGDIVLLSMSQIGDHKMLRAALDILEPQSIVFSAGGDYAASKINGIPTRNTYLEGEITYYSTRKTE